MRNNRVKEGNISQYRSVAHHPSSQAAPKIVGAECGKKLNKSEEMFHFERGSWIKQAHDDSFGTLFLTPHLVSVTSGFFFFSLSCVNKRLRC